MRFGLLLCAGVLLSAGYAQADNSEVEIVALKTEVISDASAGPVALLSSQLKGVVRVENLAYEKELTVFYKVGNESFEASASFLRLEQEPYELWSFETEVLPMPLDEQVGHTYDVTVNYKVAGQEYESDQTVCVSSGPRPVCPTEFGEMTLFE